MDTRVRIAVFVLSLLWLLLVLRMVKNRRLWERYAILWVTLGFGVLSVPLFVDVLDAILYRLGVDEPPNFLFLLGILIVLGILLQCTMEITTLVRRTRDTIQDLAILDERVRRLESTVDAGVESGGAAPASEVRE